MNWHVVLMWAFIGCVLATIGAFASMAAAFEYDPWRRAVWYVPPFVALFAVDALLAGVVYA